MAAEGVHDALAFVNRSVGNILFNDLRRILETFGFDYRIRGDHYIYTRPDIEEIINIQPDGNKAKAYQVKQVREIILKYKLGDED